MNRPVGGPVVVTGANGFLGRRLVQALTRKGIPVRALVREPSTWPAGVEGLGLDRVEVRKLDLRHLSDVGEYLSGAQAICHAGAFRPARLEDPAFADECLRVNVLATLALLEEATKRGVRKFIYYSAGNAYAPSPRPAREDDPLYPSGRAPYYLGSKVVAEFWVDHYTRARRVEGSSLRASAIYGPGMGSHGMIPAFARGLRAGTPINVQDGGRFRADFVHVDDVVDASLRALERGVVGPINVGSGTDASALDIASTLVRILGCDPALVRVAPPNAEPQSGFMPLDIGRARDELGYVPRTLEDGLRSYLAALP